ncbi:MAG TPA: hypothetical protein VLK84_15895 [Longimicrobium sp.]|nr:hypothetical protein [Longimicrobium sp.]
MSDAFAHLSAADRARAATLAETFRGLGAEEPEAWALSEVEDGIPQLARFLLLRSVWRSAEQWKSPPAEWFGEQEGLDEDADEADDPGRAEDAEPAFLAAQQAVQRILAAGVDPGDLKEIARAVFLHTAFDAVHTVDEGHDPEAGDGLPGWLLIELDAEFTTTGRAMVGLNEDLLTTEP